MIDNITDFKENDRKKESFIYSYLFYLERVLEMAK